MAARRLGRAASCHGARLTREEGLGVRLENDILVTDHGPVDLMENIPIEAEEIEELMNTEVMEYLKYSYCSLGGYHLVESGI